MIPYVDLVAQNGQLRAEILDAVARVLDHGWYILGAEVAELEAALSARLGGAGVVGVNSGTDALLMALRLAGIGPGDEVLTVSHSFVATASAIELVGATPVFVDVDDETMLMDPQLLEGHLGPRVRAVMPVHLSGFACDMTAIGDFCRQRDLVLIEDCAQAFGARHRAQAVGTFGLGAFSMHPLKVLGAVGDAGFIATGSGPQEAALRQMRNIGLRDRDHVASISGNSRLDTLHAAILLVKLRHVDAWIEARRAHAAAYRAALADMVRMPPEEGSDWPIYSAFVIRHPRRDALIEAIRRHGVDAKVHYPLAIHQQDAFAHHSVSLPVTERVVREIISLPVSPELSVRGRERVIEAVQAALHEVD